ncbi:MAG: hypothetical protein Q4Q17_05760 [Tissierellia bacterium]|nr:hypothetical protein [Tissierellia bacterium]
MSDKHRKFLEGILIFLVALLMISVLSNHYIKTAQESYNQVLRQAQIILVLIIMALTVIMTYFDRKKNAFFLCFFYLIMAGLYFIFKSAGRL